VNSLAYAIHLDVDKLREVMSIASYGNLADNNQRTKFESTVQWHTSRTRQPGAYNMNIYKCLSPTSVCSEVHPRMRSCHCPTQLPAPGASEDMLQRSHDAHSRLTRTTTSCGGATHRGPAPPTCIKTGQDGACWKKLHTESTRPLTGIDASTRSAVWNAIKPLLANTMQQHNRA
jgi:hypothetical protein